MAADGDRDIGEGCWAAQPAGNTTARLFAATVPENGEHAVKVGHKRLAPAAALTGTALATKAIPMTTAAAALDGPEVATSSALVVQGRTRRWLGMRPSDRRVA
jgi:hypothetical protein